MRRHTMIKALLVLWAGLAITSVCLAQDKVKPRPKMNVLFIAVDDLRPALRCYGNKDVVSPHIDRLAESGMLFERAYCQEAVCNPTRSSLLTGRRPDSIGVYDNGTNFREFAPDVVTLPQRFRQSGYHTQALGKIYHSCFEHAYVGTDLDDPPSWSVPSWFPGPRYYYTEQGMRAARLAYGRKPDLEALYGDGICIHNRLQPTTSQSITDPNDVRLDEWQEHFVQGLLTEAPEAPDEVLYDGQVARRAIRTLKAIKGQPFFLAVGFMKPHTPYVAPKKYWDLYDPQKIDIARNRFAPKGAPAIALLESHDHAAYSGAPDRGPLDDALTRHLTHGYYACVSYIDAQIGLVLAELERLGLKDNTVVVLWGDHGYHLGENSRWGKQTCFETATHSPLILRAPGTKTGTRTKALVEFVDIYPSLCELAGLSLPGGLEGTSFVPLLHHPDRPWKSAAFSQFPRPVPAGRTFRPGDAMGYSMRTDRYRFTEWKEMLNPKNILATELYDHRTDPQENVNLAGDPASESLVRQFHSQLERGWRQAGPPK